MFSIRLQEEMSFIFEVRGDSKIMPFFVRMCVCKGKYRHNISHKSGLHEIVYAS